MEDMRAEGKNVVIALISKHLGRQWKALTEADKKTFESQASKDRARYADEMQSYKN